MKTFMFFLLFGLLSCSQSWAHSFWINAFTSQAHHHPHAIVSLGSGHALPMDDILTSANGQVKVERFELFDPALNRVALRVPPHGLVAPEQSTTQVDVFKADLAVHKIALKKESEEGVYQLSAATTPTYYVQYIDLKGRKRLKMQPMDQVADMAQILVAVKYQAFAKAYLPHAEWHMPKPLGHGLEIIPHTDLSHVKVGDLVEVEVLFHGRPLSSSPQSKEFITAQSDGFGQQDGFALYSKLKNGRARFRVQNPGQWMIEVSHIDGITADGPLKELYGKARQLYHAASLTFSAAER